MEILDVKLEARGGSYPLRGRYREDFAPVVEAFIENFRVEEELGAATSVVLDGETVVDLWGGWAREDRSQEWDEHSTVCMMSVAKGITGIAFNMAGRSRAGRYRQADCALLAGICAGGQAGHSGALGAGPPRRRSRC